MTDAKSLAKSEELEDMFFEWLKTVPYAKQNDLTVQDGYVAGRLAGFKAALEREEVRELAQTAAKMKWHNDRHHWAHPSFERGFRCDCVICKVFDASEAFDRLSAEGEK